MAEVKAKPSKPGEVMLDEEHFQRLRISGIRILPIQGDKGLQVISSVDSEMAMQDDDLLRFSNRSLCTALTTAPSLVPCPTFSPTSVKSVYPTAVFTLAKLGEITPSS